MSFFENHDDFNQLPSRAEMSGAALYWNMVATALGNVVGGHYEEAENRRIAALRRNAEHYEQQRKPTVIQEIAAEVADVVRSAALSLVPVALWAKAEAATSALDAASAWLLDKLKNGPIAATVLERMADDDKIARRTLERARRKLGLTPRRINRRSFWMLPEREFAKE